MIVFNVTSYTFAHFSFFVHFPGLTTYNHLPGDKLKTRSKSVKPVPRSSTLMKPTASQLAKQNQPPQVATSR